MERLNQSFGIGIIEIKSNPFESKILYTAKHKELDFKTIDKLCLINCDFDKFIEQSEKPLTASDRYMSAIIAEFDAICDSYFKKDSEIEKYCENKNIPFEKTV